MSPAAAVARVGHKLEQIPIALVSHLHWDHWAGDSLFPAAEFWIQKEEIAFWTGDVARREVYKQLAHPEAFASLVGLSYANRVRVIDGEHAVFPGLRVHWVGGHTAGMQIMPAETAGGTVVLASDASHFYRNVERSQPVQIITNLPEMLGAFETIRALAGERIVAGHDPEVAARFKVLEPGVIRVA